MRHPIDPKIDCVFKALLGSEQNINLLLHFLNAMLADELASPLAEVEILNPYNEKEFLSDKLSIVDVKGRDGFGRLYQIEIQLANHEHLTKRMVYNWADIYAQQLKQGEGFLDLKPTYSIWLLAENLLPDPTHAHHFILRDEQGRPFGDHGGIWLLELKKFTASVIENEEGRWLKFFQEGERLDDEHLPDWMLTQEMKQAMQTLKTFSEKDRDYFLYQSRQEYLRVQKDTVGRLEEKLVETQEVLGQTAQELGLTKQELGQTVQELGQTAQELGQTKQELEHAEAEIARLKALLAQK